MANQPSTIQPGDTSANGRTQCQKAQFTVSSDGPSAPTLCGTVTGQHMIVEATDDCNEVRDLKKFIIAYCIYCS